MRQYMHVGNDDEWVNLAECKKLTPEQADVIFFPSSGGKPTKAKRFCEGRACPVMALCLQDAIENKLEGFQAGTTIDERRVMAAKWHIQIKRNPHDMVEALLPSKYREANQERPSASRSRRTRYLLVIDTPVGQSYDELDNMEFPNGIQ